MLTKLSKFFQVVLVLGFIFVFLFFNIMNITVTATQVTGVQTTQTVGNLVMQEFSLVINIVILVLVIFLLISISSAVKSLGKIKLTDKLRLGPSMLVNEPSSFFSNMASRNNAGTYKSSFENYRKYHLTGKKTFITALAAIVLQTFILGYIIYNFSQLQEIKDKDVTEQTQSNQFQLHEMNQ